MCNKDIVTYNMRSVGQQFNFFFRFYNMFYSDERLNLTLYYCERDSYENNI